jgi:uncharacterized protein YhfF
VAVEDAPDDAVSAWVAAARRAAPHEPIQSWKRRTFGNSAALADMLIGLIASGEKTGTFSLPAEFRDTPAAAPVVGDYYVVTRFDGRPALLYRVTEVETLPFAAIGERHVAVEGPTLREVEAWARYHWDYWTAVLARRGESPTPTMPIIFQRFTLIHAT